MRSPRVLGSVAIAAMLIAAGVSGAPRASAHTERHWTGSVTGEQHIHTVDPDGSTHTYDMSLRFASDVDLGLSAETTMTYAVDWTDFTPAGPGSCSRTDHWSGSGSVPGHVLFSSADWTQGYSVKTSGDQAASYTYTLTFAGPSTCADVLTAQQGSFLGAQLMFVTPTVPLAADPLQLVDSLTVDNQQGLSGPITWSWNVALVNRPPVALNDTAATSTGQGVDIDVLGNDSDPDGDTITISNVTDPPGGTALIQTGQRNDIRYIPDPDFVGEDVFGYEIRDTHGATDTAAVRVTVDGPAGTIIIRKETVPDGATQPFTFRGAINATLTDGQSSQRTVVAERAYTIAEDQVAGWNLTNLQCDGAANPAPAFDLAARSVTVTVHDGATVTCTFTNSQLTDLRIDGSFRFTTSQASKGRDMMAVGGDVGSVTGSAAWRVARTCVVDEWIGVLKKTGDTNPALAFDVTPPPTGGDLNPDQYGYEIAAGTTMLVTHIVRDLADVHDFSVTHACAAGTQVDFKPLDGSGRVVAIATLGKPNNVATLTHRLTIEVYLAGVANPLPCGLLGGNPTGATSATAANGKKGGELKGSFTCSYDLRS